MSSVIDWPKATVLGAAEFDVARDLLDLGPNPPVLELLSPGVTEQERAQVVRDATVTLAGKGLVTGTRFRPALVEDLRTVIAPDAQRDLVAPHGLRALVAVRARTAVLAVRLGDDVGLARIAVEDASAALVELLGPVAPGPGPEVHVPARVLVDAAESCDGDHTRLVPELLRRGTSGAEAAVLERLAAGGSVAQLGAGRRGREPRRAPEFVLVHATADGCYYQRRPAPGRIGGSLPDDAVVHAGPASDTRLTAELDRLADADHHTTAGARRH